MKAPSHREVNVQLCKLLGIDPHDVFGVHLVLSPTELPQVEVIRHVKSLDPGAAPMLVSRHFDLVPRDDVRSEDVAGAPA